MEKNSNSNPTQCEQILQYMKDYGHISQLDAFKDLRVMRLASRISELKKRGYDIRTELKKLKNRYDQTVQIASYSLAEDGFSAREKPLLDRAKERLRECQSLQNIT